MGVTCGTNSASANYRRVTDVYLQSMSLQGTLPVFRHLGEMTNLNVGNNRLGGTLPSSLGSLTKLQLLTFTNNQLIGTIPSTVGDLTQLELLSLDGNQLVGSIPSTIGNLLRLNGLNLGQNKLIGSIPSIFSGLASLRFLRFTDNQLSGTIPSLNVNSLNFVLLDYNYLTTGSLAMVPESTFSLYTLGRGSIFLNENCLRFQHPYASSMNAVVNPTRCVGKQVMLLF